MNAAKTEILKGSNTKWVSLILRLAFFALFGAAAVNKFIVGASGTVEGFFHILQNAWLPNWWITFVGWVLPYIEAALAVWLLVGFRLRAAWVASAILLVCIGFACFTAGQWQYGHFTYFYLFLSFLGLYTSSHDNVHI